MGLDSVELVMSVEEAFGIELRDEEVTGTDTPRMVIDLIFSKLKTAEEGICRSQRAFYVIRRTLLGRLDLDRKAIRPDAELRNLIPGSDEKQTWEEIRVALGARSWPRLVRPAWMSRFLFIVGLVIFAGAVLASASLSVGVAPSIGGGILVCGLFGIAAAILTRPFCVCIPAHLKSIRDVIPDAITSDRMAGWTREEVAVVVKRLTMEQLGVDAASYTEDSRFVEDFNMD